MSTTYLPDQPNLAQAAPGKFAGRVFLGLPGNLWAAVGVALAIRLCLIPFLLPEQMDTVRAHWPFGYEAGRLARSLAEGRGFADPLFARTGPSAWMTPGYPAILALIFKAFGIYSATAAVVALVFNAVVSAVTAIPVALIARDCFGDRAAKPAAWLWTFFPYAVYFPMERLWETWLATLLLAVLFWLVVRAGAGFHLPFWFGYAALWAVAAMVSPSLCVLLPVFVAYAAIRLHRQGSNVLLPLVLFCATFAAGIFPWTLRNYQQFHQMVPMRDSFGLALRLGTAGPRDHWAQYDLGPWHNDAEWAEFQRLGELRYMQREQALAIKAIRERPGYFGWTSLRRAVFVWTGFWSLHPAYLAEEPMDLANIPVCTAFTVLTAIGLWRAFRARNPAALLFAVSLFVFPLIYYTTSPEVYYRRPLDSLMVVLTVCAFSRRRSVPGAPQPNVRLL